jgi:hypothetical protein
VSGNKRLTAVLVSVPLGIVAAAWALLFGVMDGQSSDKTLVAPALGFTGVVVTACVSAIGVTVNRQAERRLEQQRIDERNRLRLDAAMRAGELMSGANGQPPAPAAIASGLLALTKLDQEGLAVTLLVDLWSDENNRVSTEAAILVIDAALDSEKPSAQLVAAELLCRNATRLMPYQSLHWPSAIEGTWSSDFNAKTKLLVVEALIRMTLAGPTDESALRAVAVRLYGFWDSEDRRSPDGIRVRGCIGKLLKAVIDTIKTFGYRDFIQGNRNVTVEQLCEAADSAKTNPDGFLDQLSERYACELNSWAQRCVNQPQPSNGRPPLASGECGTRISRTSRTAERSLAGTT